MGNFVIAIRRDDEETLKKYRRDVQYTKLAGSFQGAAAGEAMEGIGEGAAKGGVGSAPAVVAGMGLAGAGFSAANSPRTPPLPKCRAQGRAAPQVLPMCGPGQPPPRPGPTPPPVLGTT